MLPDLQELEVAYTKEDIEMVDRKLETVSGCSFPELTLKGSATFGRKPFGHMPVGQMSVAKLSVGQMFIAKRLWAKCLLVKCESLLYSKIVFVPTLIVSKSS